MKKGSKITINNVEYEIIDSIGNGGGSEAVYVVKNTKKFLDLIQWTNEMGNLSAPISRTDDKENQLVNQYQSIIGKVISKTEIQRTEKKIVNYLIGCDYYHNIRQYKIIKNKIIKHNKSSKTQIELPKEPNDNRVFCVIKKFNDEQSKQFRFINEIDFCLKEQHKNIIKYIDKSENNDGLLVVMPLYPLTLRDVIKERQKYRPETKIKMMLQLCSALKYLHKKKIIHRDIKPENIFVDYHYNLVLADFGIAHFPEHNITQKKELLANRLYSAPEQTINGKAENVGIYSDIYSLGLIINEMFTGEILNGSEFVRIADFYPSYDWLDNIVDLMTKQSFDKRISDIDFIINEIKIKQGDLIENKTESELYRVIEKYNFGSELIGMPKKQQREIMITIENDISIGQHIFYRKTKEELNSFEINYHSFIGYSADNFLINLAIQSLLFDVCKNKFNYESNVIETVKYEPISLQNEIFKDFEEKIKSYKIKDSQIDRLNKILKYFSACSLAHCSEIAKKVQEIIEEVNKALINSPIIYLITRFRQILSYEVYDTLVKEDKYLIERHISPTNYNKYAHSLNDIFRTIDSNSKMLLDNIKNFLVKRYKISIDQPSQYEIMLNAVFNSKKKYYKFRKDCLCNINKNLLKDNEKELLIADVNDMLRIVESGRNTYKIKLDSYYLKSILPKLFPLWGLRWL